MARKSKYLHMMPTISWEGLPRNEEPIFYTNASAPHAVKLQMQVAALKSRLANPTEETPHNMALNASGSAEKSPQNSSQYHCFEKP